MDEQTQSSSQTSESSGTEEATTETPVTEGEAAGSTPSDDSGSSSGEPVQDETDWQHVAELIATETEKKQPTYQTIEATVFGEEVELRIVHQATVGEILVSVLLTVTIATFLLRWLFKVVWRR
ncbi:hypothetical protein ABEO98_21575 [Brevibacillus parabrevis]|uniref:hypothetical protein n=1 Tax=Brevibacillus parabrevis TaxID=54914 RepID=UPI002E232A0C|nr:hypothetical protein [Brevibacillus parabrevis]